MYHLSSTTAVGDEVMRHHARQTNEETIIRLGHEVAGLQTTLQGNQDAFAKQMSYLEATTSSDVAATTRLQRLLARSNVGGEQQWVPAAMLHGHEEELRVKTDACEEYQNTCNVLLGAIAAEIAGGGGGAGAVLESLRQALQDHGFGSAAGGDDGVHSGGSPSTAAALLATLLPSQDQLM
jgi:hypothetical protein